MTPTAEATESSPRLLLGKTARALGWLVVFGAVCQLTPGLDPLRWMPDDPLAFVPGLFRTGGEGPGDEVAPAEIDDEALVSTGPVATGVAEEPAPPPAPLTVEGHGPARVWDPTADLPREPPVRTTAAGIPLLAIEDPQGNMRRFYRALARAEDGVEGALTRVVHYGDSLITGDYVTRTVRRLLQKRFGDGGHGFVLAARPSPWYGRDNLVMRTSDDWQIHRLTRPGIADGGYGLGGVTVRTAKAGQWVELRPAPPDDETEAPLGASVARMQVLYHAQPRGGRFAMAVDGREVEVDTRTEEPGSRLAEILVPDGAHTFRLRTLGRGEVRLFGVVFERQGPGVVYDSLGLDGARAKLLRRYDPEHWHDQLRLRRPDLLVLHYGTNESQFAGLSAKRYHEDLSQTVGHLRAALPGVSCLLVGPLDRAEKDENGKLVTRDVVRRIVKVQREVAWRQGCAFWNTWRAMGGEGSMARWYRMKPPLGGGDLTHPTARGADRVGAMLYLALMDGYEAWRRPPASEPAAPAPDAAPEAATSDAAPAPPAAAPADPTAAAAPAEPATADAAAPDAAPDAAAPLAVPLPIAPPRPDAAAPPASDARPRGERPMNETASLLPLRNPDDPEVYWVRRAARDRFLAGFHCFPGGRVDAADLDAAGGDPERAARLAALRETAEEVGWLPGVGRLPADLRHALRAGRPLVAVLAELARRDPAARQSSLALDALVPAGAWQAPPYLVARFVTRFYAAWLPPDAALRVDPDDPELQDGGWIRPADALAAWDRGEVLLAPPTRWLLHALAHGAAHAPERFTATAMTRGEDHPEHASLRPHLTLFPLRTPTLPPATHTNCYLYGEGELLIVEPASPDPVEQARLDRHLDARIAAGARVRAIALTHHHHDHIGGVAHLARRLGVPVLAHPETASRVPFATEPLHEGDTLTLAGGHTLDVIFTPGHAPGHLCFIDRGTGDAIVGDMVAGVGSILIDPDEGDMALYLRGLERLAERDPASLLPSHGPAIGAARARIAEYIEHRLHRERQVIDALARGPAELATLVERVYTDVPPLMKAGKDGGLAGRSLRAHLDKLRAEGRARYEDGRWSR
ncbi:MAG: MBL fold metallo-hydrolase [bacterium]